MRRFLLLVLFVALVHLAYHAVGSDTLEDAWEEVRGDYVGAANWAAVTIEGVSAIKSKVEFLVRQRTSDLSEGANGLVWQSTPQGVKCLLGEPDDERWHGENLKLIYHDRQLTLQFFAPDRREGNAKLYSIRLAAANARVTRDIRVGQKFDHIAATLGGEGVRRAGTGTIKTDGITLFCRLNTVAECQQISVVNNGAKR